MGNYDFSKCGEEGWGKTGTLLPVVSCCVPGWGDEKRGQAMVSPLFRLVAASASTCARNRSRSAGDGDILLAVEQKRHRRAHLGEVSIHVEELLARVGAIDSQEGS